MIGSGTSVRARGRRRRGSWVFFGIALAGIGAAFAFEAYESVRTIDGGLDRVRWGLRQSLAPPGTDALESLDWTRIDLAPAGDTPDTGTWQPRRNEVPGGAATPSARDRVLLGGASSMFAVKIVEGMEPGATYELSVGAAPEGPRDPDVRIHLARELLAPDASTLPLASQAIPPGWRSERAAYHEFTRARLRYTATPEDANRPLFAHIESRAADPAAAVSWNAAQVLVYPPADSRRVRDARLERIWDRGVDDVVSGAVLALFLSPPLAQLVTLGLLMRGRRRDAPADGPGIRLVLVLGLAVAPIQELLAWSLFSIEEWQGQRGPGYWRYVWTSTRALVWIPWGLAASILVAAAAVVGPRWRRARLVAGVLALRAATAATFVVASLLLQRDSVIFRADQPFLFLFPAAAAANDLLYRRQLLSRATPDASGRPGTAAWLTGWLITLGTQLLFALGTYGRLASDRPSGDCFVVTAAAQGHPWIVRSRLAPDGRRINDQLEALRQLETRIRAAAPRFHRCLRALYDRVGPVAAGWIAGPLRADLAYLGLKPLEWLARASGSPQRKAITRSSASPPLHPDRSTRPDRFPAAAMRRVRGAADAWRTRAAPHTEHRPPGSDRDRRGEHRSA